MQLPLKLHPGTGTGLQAQLFEQIRVLITRGSLRPGARLPASRVLAGDLGVSRNTVVLAYERLTAEGYVEMRPPVGTFVARAPLLEGLVPVAAPADSGTPPADREPTVEVVFRGEAHVVVPAEEPRIRHDFRVGRSDGRLFPAKAWRQALREVLRTHRAALGEYCDPAGLPELRRAIADYVGVARGIRTRSTEILVTSGIQQGFNILARLLVREGTAVGMEMPGYRGAANLFASYGARLRPMPVDAEGVDPARLPRDVRLAYLTPSHQYPTGACLSLARRHELLARARRHGILLVEDDYDSDFHYEEAPLPALRSLDESGHVAYLGTFSKCLAAGLRIGYMILPPALVGPAVAVKALLDNSSPWLPQQVLADFIHSGAFAHHVRRLRTICRGRRDRLLAEVDACFGAGTIRGEQSGMHVLWEPGPSWPAATRIERSACRHGIGIHGFAASNVWAPRGDDAQAGLLLGYAALDEAEISAGIRRLHSILTEI